MGGLHLETRKLDVRFVTTGPPYWQRQRVEFSAPRVTKETIMLRFKAVRWFLTCLVCVSLSTFEQTAQAQFNLGGLRLGGSSGSRIGGGSGGLRPGGGGSVMRSGGGTRPSSGGRPGLTQIFDTAKPRPSSGGREGPISIADTATNRPPKPPRPSSGSERGPRVDWSGLLPELIPAIRNRLQSGRTVSPPSTITFEPRFDRPRVVERPPAPIYTYAKPTITAPSNHITVPSNRVTVPPIGPAIQRAPVQPNEVDTTAKPKGNQLGLVGFGPTAVVRRSVQQDLQAESDTELANTEQALNGAAMDQAATEDLLRRTPDDKEQAVTDAIRDRDPDALRTALMNAGFMEPDLTIETDKLRVTATFEGYVDALANGTPDQVTAARDALETAHQDALRSQNLSFADRNRLAGGLRQSLNNQDAILAALDGVMNGNLGGGFPDGGLLPEGTATVVSTPSLPEGETVVAAEDVVLSGVGPEGEFGVETVDAEEIGATLGVPLVAGMPVEATDADAVTSTGIILDNPSSSNGPVSFTVNGNTRTLEPGYVQRLPEGESYQIEFDRGAGNGKASYRLEAGSYQFGVTANGWDLWKVTYKVTIDNSANPKAFHFLFDNQQLSVRAHKGLELKSAYPLLVSFDQGQGGEPAMRRLLDGVYKVGVTPTGLDLFPATRQGAATSQTTRNGNPGASQRAGSR